MRTGRFIVNPRRCQSFRMVQMLIWCAFNMVLLHSDPGFFFVAWFSMTKYCPLNVKRWPSPNSGLQREVTCYLEYISATFHDLAAALSVRIHTKCPCKCAATLDGKDPLSEHLHAATTRPTPLHGWYIGSWSECVSRTAQSGQWSLGRCLTLESEPRIEVKPLILFHTYRIVLTSAAPFTLINLLPHFVRMCCSSQPLHINLTFLIMQHCCRQRVPRLAGRLVLANMRATCTVNFILLCFNTNNSYDDWR
jgi:hypothetical protein